MRDYKMSIFVDKIPALLVQGITGREGQFHTRQCIAYGTNVVAGVTPGKGGQEMDDVPVFNTVREAVEKTGANCSMIFVPPAFAADAIMEAADADDRTDCCHHGRDSGHGYDAGEEFTWPAKRPA